MNEAGYLNSLRERSLRRQILTTVGKVVNSPFPDRRAEQL